MPDSVGWHGEMLRGCLHCRVLTTVAAGLVDPGGKIEVPEMLDTLLRALVDVVNRTRRPGITDKVATEQLSQQIRDYLGMARRNPDGAHDRFLAQDG